MFFDIFTYPRYYLSKGRELISSLVGDFLYTENNEIILTELNEPIEIDYTGLLLMQDGDFLTTQDNELILL